MKKVLNSVQEFHEAFGHPVAQEPENVTADVYTLRHQLMDEENKEYLEACKNNDVVEIADALGDQLYILAGTILAHGMQHVIVDVFNEIQRSNMSKLGEDGKPIFREDGKVLKGPNYSPPNLKQFLGDED